MKKRTLITSDSFRKGYFRDLWAYREVLYILSWRDIKVRYKQTLMGALWAILRPLITMLIFTFVFGHIAGLATGINVPYSMIVLTGLLPWYFFSQAVSEGANSIVANERLITKVYFPRILIPVSTIATALMDFFISFLLLIFLLLFFDISLTLKAVFTGFFLFILGMLALGTGLILATLNVKFRDFRYVIPFLLQVGLYISPVGFDTSAIPEKWTPYYALNPLVGIIEGFRWALLDSENLRQGAVFYSFSFSTLLLVVGFRYFVSQEKSFADVI